MGETLSGVEVARPTRAGAMTPALALAVLLVPLLIAGCTPIDPRAQQSDIQRETGHVDSGGGGSGGSM